MAPEAESAEHRRRAAQQARRRWAEEVTQALNEQRQSIHAAAKAIGISPGRLQAWLSQDVEPSPRVMGDLAQVIGRGHIHLLQLLEWLPPDLGDVPLRLEATEKLTEALAEAQRWVQGATRAVGLHGGSLLAGALLERSWDWEVIIRSSIRGRRYPTRYATRLGLAPIDPTAATTADDRRAVERLVRAAIRRTGAEWLPPEWLAGQSWPKRSDLVLAVPDLCASRPRGLRPNLLVPPSIVVVGIPHAGCKQVAALLAGLLDWAFVDVVTQAREQFGLDIDAPTEVYERAQVEVARRFLADPEGAGRQTVWSYRDPRPVLQTFRDLGTDLPLVISIQAPDSMVEHVMRRRTVEGHDDAELVDSTQHVARRTLAANRNEKTYLLLDLPELPVEDVSPDTVDVYFDAYVDLALRAATWLSDNHGAPALDEATGVLADLHRADRENNP